MERSEPEDPLDSFTTDDATQTRDLAPQSETLWPAPPSRPERRPHPVRDALLAGLVGAVVGGLIAGAVVAAVDGNGKTTTVVSNASDAPARESTQLAKPGDIRSILDKVQPAVVRIDATLTGAFGSVEQGTGTGFIIDPSGVIVTNNHVVANASSVVVTLNDGDQVKAATVRTAPAFDLAVVKIDRKNLPTVALGDSDQLQVGDAVVAIGNALALEGGSGPTVTTGIVSGLGRDLQISTEENLHNLVQTDAAINPGNSGGPLVDVRGRVIGINTAIASPQESNNVGFAIAISGALPIVDDLRAGREPEAALLGITSNALTPSLAAQKHLGTTTGAIVLTVAPGTPAAKAGMQRDDVIVAMGGTEVRRPTDVFSAVRRHRPGDTVDIVIVRGSDRRTLHVTLASTSG